MKLLTHHWQRTERPHLIARFGATEFVARPDGRTELRGGSRSDLAEAREWISLFMHDAVPRRVPAN